MVSLYLAMDSLRKRFGQNAVKRACGVWNYNEKEEKALKRLQNEQKEQQQMTERLKRVWNH